jgi:hypothetical protein
VAVVPNELVGLRVAMGKGGLDERSCEESDLTGGVGVFLVEE